MTEQEIINAVGILIVSNWSYFLGGLIAFTTGCVLLSWRIASAFHRREKELLQAELNHQKERFSQFEAIVDQRISLLQTEAESLNKKINHSKEPIILYQKAIGSDEASDTKKDELPIFSRVTAKETDKIKEVLNRTEIISSILKNVMGSF